VSAPLGTGGGAALPRRGRGRMAVFGAALALVAITMMLLAITKFPELYGVFCRAFGVAQNPNGARAVAAPSQRSGRFIDVIFEGVAMDRLPVHFYPDKTEVRLEVGTDASNTYHFKNVSDHAVSFRPVHQISPVAAARPEVFGLKVCFCFANQTIPAGETRDFPVVFTFTSALDERINTVTVRYSLFEIAADAPLTEAQKAIQESMLPAGAIVSPGAATGPAHAPQAPGGAP
jgi:cytochrome c oxidase assembly protein subunit 11